MLRARAAVVALAAACALLGGSARPAAAGPHPLFDDRGTLEWHTDLDGALAAARAQGKLVFVDSGRRLCPNCRTLIARYLPVDAIRPRISAVAVGYADDCDQTDPRVSALFSRFLPDAQMLPLVAFVTPDLQWVTGWSGSTDVATICAHLSRAESVAAQGRTAQKARDEAVRRSEAERAAREEAARRVRPPAEPVRRAPAPAPTPSPTPPPTPTPPRAAPECPSDDGGDPACDGGSCAVPRAAPPRAPAPAPPPPPARPVLPRVEAARPAPARLPAPSPLPAPRLLRPSSLLERARAAATAKAWGDLARLGDEASQLPAGPERAEVEALAQRAHAWALDAMTSAVRAAEERRFDDARRLLDQVRRQMADRPIARDVDRGVAAIDRLAALAATPDGLEPDTGRRQAYADFRGSRWAALFRRG